MGEAGLLIEVSDKMISLLDTLVATGMYGPSRETAAQRLLEQKMMELVKSWAPTVK